MRDNDEIYTLGCGCIGIIIGVAVGMGLLIAVFF